MIQLLVAIGAAMVAALLAWLWSRARIAALDSAAAELRRHNQDLTNQLTALQAELQSERQHRIEAHTRLQQERQNLQQQRALLDQAEQKLAETFKALASDALDANRKRFLDLASQSLQTILAEAKGDLGKRHQAIDALLKPLQEALSRYEQHAHSIEQARQEAYGQLRQQLLEMASREDALQRQTSQLVTALRNPQVRGRWGELTLRRVAELAGMSQHCDFVEQFSLDTDSGRLRPDMIVKLPADRQIVVDAKAPLSAYLDAVAAPDEQQRAQALASHAHQIRTHMDKLASKAYWQQLPQAPEFVVLFLPGECFFSAALECDRSLIEDGFARGVVLATPTTLLALLRAVAYGWRHERMARSAEQVSELARQLHDRIRTFAEHLDQARASLERAVSTFNKAVGSLEIRVLPSVRRFQQLGVPVAEQIPTVEPVQQTPRPLHLPQPDQPDPPQPDHQDS